MPSFMPVDGPNTGKVSNEKKSICLMKEGDSNSGSANDSASDSTLEDEDREQEPTKSLEEMEQELFDEEAELESRRDNLRYFTGAAEGITKPESDRTNVESEGIAYVKDKFNLYIENMDAERAKDIMGGVKGRVYTRTGCSYDFECIV